MKTPKNIVLRSYQVGFGDCFLLSFVYTEQDKRHILIDFGTTELPRKRKPSEHMPKLAKQIATDCDGQLTAIVATHRHADHISGFGTDGKTGRSGEIIRALKPKVVIQPWTEDPKAAKNARQATSASSRSTKSFISGLNAMHRVSQAVLDLARRPPPWMGVQLAKELQFLGMDNIKNRSAVENLIKMGKAPGAKATWVRYGSNPGLGKLLPGVKVRVLGPPSLEQSEKIRKQRSKDVDQFWHLLAGASTLNAQPLAKGLRGPASRKKTSERVPPEARWFRDKLQRLRGQQLLEIVRSLDSQMNNTSIILLFEVGSKKLLFPGDAQIENWSYALEDAPEHKAVRKLLSRVDLYKVGHHGSLNATPKKLLWEGFEKRGPGRRLKTALSTLPGKHGKTSNDTEVPRRPLLKALKADSELKSTNDLRASELYFDLALKV
jgi:beta-lactamase superfamily II metal-dependent hydrolase